MGKPSSCPAPVCLLQALSGVAKSKAIKIELGCGKAHVRATARTMCLAGGRKMLNFNLKLVKTSS